MKRKTMVTAAACLLPVMAAHAAASDAMSSNVGGCTIVKIGDASENPARTDVIGIQYGAFGGGAQRVNDVFRETGIAGFVPYTETEPGDVVSIRNAEGDGYALLHVDASGLWHDAQGVPSDTVLPPGSAVRFATRSPGACFLALCGEVVAGDVELVLPYGDADALAAYPFPVPFPFAGMDWLASEMTGGTGPEDADTLYAWEPGHVDYTGYFLGDWDNWHRVSGDDAPVVSGIPAGKGFRYMLNGSADDVVITFPGVLPE